MTSNPPVRALATASGPEAASPATSMSGLGGQHAAQPGPDHGMIVGQQHADHPGHLHADLGAAAGDGGHLDGAADLAHPVTHARAGRSRRG